MTTYARHVSIKATPQSRPIPGREAEMVHNSAGAFSFTIDDWARLRRFLVLGNEGSTYYATEQELTQQNAAGTLRAMAADGPRAVEVIRDVSLSGVAFKNDPALFALALGLKLGDVDTRRAASRLVPEVARQSEHLFSLASSINALGGFGPLTRRAFAAWYLRHPDEVFFQIAKYKERHGYTHRDLLRMAHPRINSALPVSQDHSDIFAWAIRGTIPSGVDEATSGWKKLFRGVLAIARETDARRAAQIVTDYKLAWQMVPSELLQKAEVWEALLAFMPPQALLRNLGTLTSLGVIAPFSAGLRLACAKIARLHLPPATHDTGEGEAPKRAQVQRRTHPLAVLQAMFQYGMGHGLRSREQTWTPSQQIIDALDGAFYATFGAIEPSGKRLLLALDVSGSMAQGTVGGIAGFTPRLASAAMALVTAATEANHLIVAFGDQMVPIALSPTMRLDQALASLSGLPFVRTDCAKPMTWALENNIAVDGIVEFTDNESWAGPIHVTQALEMYRQKMGLPTRFVAVGLTATEFSVADPRDALGLNVAGFSGDAAEMISLFMRGSI